MTLFRNINENVREAFGSFSIIFNFVVTDIIKRPRSYKIGVFSIFLVISFLVFLQSVLELTPIIFIKIAEDQNGQYDLTITPIAAENDTRRAESGSNRFAPMYRAVNLTEVEEKIGNMSQNCWSCTSLASSCSSRKPQQSNTQLSGCRYCSGLFKGKISGFWN